MKPHEENPASIKFYVKEFIVNNKALFKNKKVLDLPAGSGVTSRILKEIGANPSAYDLFPEFFNEKSLKCKFCNIASGIPEKDSSFDFIICQEGIEHFPDPLSALKEFNRILKKDGLLILTTPNYSSLQSRLSYFSFESENHKRFMPPNEFDSIWFADKKTRNPEYYFGHAFLLGIQKLRFLWKISGFELIELISNRVKSRNIFLMIFYPYLYLSSFFLLKKNLKKNRDKEAQRAFKEQFRLNTSKITLLHSHIFIMLKKADSFENTYERYKKKNQNLYNQT